MTDKYELITALGAKTQQVASTVLGLDADVCNQLYRSVMKPDELMLWDLANYWEQECLRCIKAEAHFSAMISAVAMNEALLCYLCLVYEQEVRAYPMFSKVAGGRSTASLSKLVGEWKLKTLLQFAFALKWVPANLIDSQKADLLLAALAQMRDDPLPSDFTFATEDLQELLTNEPGRGMLEMTQNLRNYVHPTRWLRLQHKLQPQSFTLWCEIGTKLSAELRDALMLTATQSHRKKIADAQNGIGQLLQGSEAEQRLFRALIASELTQRTGVDIPSDLNVEALLDELHQAFSALDGTSED